MSRTRGFVLIATFVCLGVDPAQAICISSLKETAAIVRLRKSSAQSDLRIILDRPSMQRSPEDNAFIKKLKNDSHFAARFGSTRQPSIFDFGLNPLENLHDSEFFEAYRYLVANLRAGDSVVIDGEVFELGEFLGAGNATHIFELRGEENLVIRIPFPSKALLALHASNRGSAWRSLGSLLNPPTSDHFGVIRVRRVDPILRFAIVDKIHHEENGGEFLDRYEKWIFAFKRLEASFEFNNVKIEQGLSRAHAWAAEQIARDQGIPVPEVSEILERFKKLRAAVWSASSAEISYRQFVWDLDQNKWMLVDW